MHSCQKIAIIRRNGLGDVLCALPLVAHFKRQMHGCKVTLFVDKRAESLVPYLKTPDEIIVIQERKNKYLGLIETLWKCKDRAFDLAISAKSSPMKLMNFFLYGLKARHRLAYTDNSWSTKLVNCTIPFDPKLEIHQALRALHLVDRTFSSVPKELYPRLDVTPLPLALERPILFLSVSNNRIGSTLDFDKYQRILSSLPRRFSVVINCETHDIEKANVLKQMLPMPCEVISTATLGDCLRLIAACDMLLIGDGGLMHFAAALDKPQVVLFGGTKVWEWAPLSDKAICLSDEHNVNFIDETKIYHALESLL